VSGVQLNRFTKDADVSSHADPCGFDITFFGDGKSKGFVGVLYAEDKEYEWKGGSPSIQTVQRQGNNEAVKGSDGLALDNLLYGISSLAKERDKDGRSIDLAQKEADYILGRVSTSFCIYSLFRALTASLAAYDGQR
jgi:hypothetical protein